MDTNFMNTSHGHIMFSISQLNNKSEHNDSKNISVIKWRESDEIDSKMEHWTFRSL